MRHHHRHRLLLAALVGAGLGAGLGACHGGPRIEHLDPGETTAEEGTGVSSEDVLKISELAVESMRRRIGAHPLGGPWEIRVERLTQDLSVGVDMRLLTDQIVTRINRDGADFVQLYLPESEAELDLRERPGLTPTPELRRPDLVLSGDLRGIEHNRASGITRFMQFAFRVTTLTGRVVWSDTFEIKKRERRHVVYQ